MEDYEFNFLNYHTEYSCKGDVNKPMGGEACFGAVFRSNLDVMKNTYEIHVYKGVQLLAKNQDNACFLELPQIYKHINILKNILNFKYKIKEEINKDLIPYYNVFFTYEGSMLEHRLILTWIRYLYEFPYNMYLRDIVKLKQINEFSKINPINLFMYLSCSRPLGRDIHSIFDFHYLYKPMHYNDIKSRIKTMNIVHQSMLNYFFLKLQGGRGNQFTNYQLHRNNNYHESDFWENKFEDRVNQLKEVLQFIKLHKNE